MARLHNRRTLRLERLENREVLSGPTAEQAYMLELINLARTNPTEAAQEFTTNLDANVSATVAYYGVNLSEVQNAIASSAAQPPLAWSDQVAQAAQGQSQYQADAGVQSHTGAGGSDLNTRLQNAGVNNIQSSGEDIYAYSTSPMEAMEAFMIDWGVANDGHRINIQQPGVSATDAYQEAGIGIVNTSSGSAVGPEVMTVDFTSQSNAQPQLFGFAYNDPDNTGFYAPGQGQGGVTIQATNLSTGATVSTQTQSAGYYALSLAPGSYEVTATENGQVIQTQNVNINNVNVEVDYNLTQLANSAPSSATPAAQVITSAATAAPSTSSSNSNSTPQPITVSIPQNTVSIPQNNTVVIPQSSNTSSSSSGISSIFNQMFGTGLQFSMTSWGAGS